MTVPPTNPALVARAYQFAAAAGSRPPAAKPPAASPATPRPAAEQSATVARLGPAARTAPPAPSASPPRPAPSAPVSPVRAAPSLPPAKAAALVAAVVPGSIDFRGDTPAATRSDPSSFPLYRKPTDRNEIETALLVGRRLDTTG